MTEAKPPRSLADKLTLWIGIIGSVITISLTIWNTHTKQIIDQREKQLKSLELNLKERLAGLEESKERVDRYKWVLELFPKLNGTNEKEKNFTISLIRLALTKDEAEQLFSGLQTSADTALQSVGQNGITAIQNQPIALLVSQMNADNPAVRKSAVASLERDYGSSSQAVSLALRTLDIDNMKSLSPSAVINGLYFLSNTDPAAWDKKQLFQDRQIIARIQSGSPGEQTNAALNNLKTQLQKVQVLLK